ncbi:hypothetical protein, no similarity [Maudiozyma saulgeensis]|uniref:Uncharacterized protein n=1 Tax=Maudiozyma saulgeensis TaxID=1789683 RepID=A0A1X7R6X6_9SACH|nr:hypothetical protein, no similarity [Kazachstania saulgeensis]
MSTLFTYEKLGLFSCSLTLTLYSLYNMNLTSLIISSYLASRITESVTPALMLKCPECYGFEGIEYARRAGVLSHWPIWQGMSAVIVKSLFDSLNGGCNILAAGVIISNFDEELDSSVVNVSSIINRISIQLSTRNYLQLIQDANYLCIVLLGLLTVTSENLQRIYTKKLIAIVLVTKIILSYKILLMKSIIKPK